MGHTRQARELATNQLFDKFLVAKKTAKPIWWFSRNQDDHCLAGTEFPQLFQSTNSNKLHYIHQFIVYREQTFRHTSALRHFSREWKCQTIRCFSLDLQLAFLNSPMLFEFPTSPTLPGKWSPWVRSCNTRHRKTISNSLIHCLQNYCSGQNALFTMADKNTVTITNN